MSSSGPPTIQFQPPGSDDLAFWERVAAEFRNRFGNMTSTASTATPFRHAFEQRVVDMSMPKSDINALILDYLTMEGYPQAAANFSKEANLQPMQEDPAIRARQEIRNLIHQGHIQDAIESLNDLDPEILDQDAHLHFALLRLQLVELIRNSSDGDKNVMTAIQFARDQLGPRASRQPAFLKPLENTMAILLYPRDSLKPEQAAIMHPNLRREVSDMVNKAILHRQTQRREAAIRHLVKIRAWAEESARSSRKNLPERIELGLNGEDSSHENGSEPMVTN
ncbi:putative ran binding protein in the microtubule-organising centre [Diaporthe ampelina]|uniref:Putative ran binding protein in the microtubule-organising centre n=1 Tax=Diaporthe ampelina TaxID=1214573 RepID=A0A0G2FN50_9PEZI|nr:putative ran binding protein in the microtubule-organising centre [Diaporthe ampelina]